MTGDAAIGKDRGRGGHNALVVDSCADDRRLRFEAVVAAAYVPLQRYLRRRVDPATADDVLGDVLLVMWRRADDIPAETSLAWCYGVARGCLANSARARHRQLRLVRRLAEDRSLQPASPLTDPGLERALDSLPAKDAEILRLWAWEGLAPRELAVVLGISANAASIRLHRATKRLKEKLGRPNTAPGKDAPASGHEGVVPREEAPR